MVTLLKLFSKGYFAFKCEFPIAKICNQTSNVADVYILLSLPSLPYFINTCRHSSYLTWKKGGLGRDFQCLIRKRTPLQLHIDDALSFVPSRKSWRRAGLMFVFSGEAHIRIVNRYVLALKECLSLSLTVVAKCCFLKNFYNQSHLVCILSMHDTKPERCSSPCHIHYHLSYGCPCFCLYSVEYGGGACWLAIDVL